MFCDIYKLLLLESIKVKEEWGWANNDGNEGKLRALIDDMEAFIRDNEFVGNYLLMEPKSLKKQFESESEWIQNLKLVLMPRSLPRMDGNANAAEQEISVEEGFAWEEAVVEGSVTSTWRLG